MFIYFMLHAILESFVIGENLLLFSDLNKDMMEIPENY